MSTGSVAPKDESLLVGIIQTTLKEEEAWHAAAPSPQMSASEDSRAWREILRAMRAFQDGGEKPKVILLPELSLPRTRLDSFDRLVASLNVLAIVGADFGLNHTARTASNDGIVFVPGGFFRNRPSKYCARVRFGKTHAAPEELKVLAGLRPPWTFRRDSNVYVFDAEAIGRIGVSICYDFMDVERALMYRGRIHHLFVLAHNRDLSIFQSLSSSLSRTVYCNVVVCNTGQYGGSLVVSPFNEPFRRIVFAHSGATLFTTQVIRLPVASLERAMRRTQFRGPDGKVSEVEFKEPPPGFIHSID